MALRYNKLPDIHRIQLWSSFFDMYTTNDPDIRFDRGARQWVQSKEVTEMELNGREIRNGMHNPIPFFEHISYEYLSHSSGYPSRDPRPKEKDIQKVAYERRRNS